MVTVVTFGTGSRLMTQSKVITANTDTFRDCANCQGVGPEFGPEFATDLMYCEPWQFAWFIVVKANYCHMLQGTVFFPRIPPASSDILDIPEPFFFTSGPLSFGRNEP